MTQEPLIYTTQGNVPVASLTYEHEWQDGTEAVRFMERYRDSVGDIVKESVHVYLKQPLETTSNQGIF